MTKTLNHDSLVRLPDWNATAKVGTLNGFCPDFAETARERGNPEAWTVFAGHVISADPGHYERIRANNAAATVIDDGEVVTIEGRNYRVLVNKGNHAGPRNSDPIQFVPVK